MQGPKCLTSCLLYMHQHAQGRAERGPGGPDGSRWQQGPCTMGTKQLFRAWCAWWDSRVHAREPQNEYTRCSFRDSLAARGHRQVAEGARVSAGRCKGMYTAATKQARK